MRFTITLILLLFALPAMAVDTALVDRDGVTQPLVLNPANIGAATAAQGALADNAIPKTAANAVKGSGVYTVDAAASQLATPSFTPVIWGGDFTQNSKLGVNGMEVEAYWSMSRSGNSYGNNWNVLLDRLNYTFEFLHNSGAKYYRVWQTIPRQFHTVVATAGGPITLTDSLGWEAVDKVVELGRKYGIKVILTVPTPFTYLTGSSGYQLKETYRTNWGIPYAQYLATRYQNDSDIVSIDPMNEINWIYQGGFFTDYTAPSPNLDPHWITYQRTVYDAIKAIAPKLPVHLASATHVSAYNSTTTTEGMLTQLNAAGYASKFDEACQMHLYPTASLVVSPDYYSNAAITAGKGGTADITAVAAQLAAIGRTDAKVIVGEFWQSWAGGGTAAVTNGSATVNLTSGDFAANATGDYSNGDSIHFVGDAYGVNYTISSRPSNTQIVLTAPYAGTTRSGIGHNNVTREDNSAAAMTQLYNFIKGNNSVLAANLWGVWGSDRQVGYSVVNNYFGFQGGGMLTEDTRRTTSVGSTFATITNGPRLKNTSVIKFRGGTASELPAFAEAGEPLWVTDTGALYVGAGNTASPVKIGPYALPATLSDLTYSGTTHKAASVSGTLTAGKQATFDANGNVIASSYDVGAAGGGGSGTVSSGTAGQFAQYAADGTAVSGHTLTSSDVTTALGFTPKTGDFSSNTTTSVDGEVVLFSGTAGKTGKRATGTGFAKLTSGVLSASTISESDVTNLTSDLGLKANLAGATFTGKVKANATLTGYSYPFEVGGVGDNGIMSIYGTLNSATTDYSPAMANTAILAPTVANRTLYGDLIQPQVDGANNITSVRGLAARVDLKSTYTGVVSNLYNAFIDSPVLNGATGSIANNYGLRINNMTAGTSVNYSIYTGTGAVRFGDNVTSTGDVSAKTFTPTIPAATTYGATTTIDLSAGDSPSVTLTGNTTLAFSNPKAGQWHRLNLVQDATGSRTVTWPSTGLQCTWRNTASNAAPTLLTGANKVDTIIIHTLSTSSAECWAGGNK